MSTISTPDNTQARHGRPPSCSSYSSDAYLIIDAIEPLDPADPDVVDVSYTCIECDSFYARAATVAQVARILNRSETEPGVLRFGGDYIHCGEPMTTRGTDVRSIEAPAHADQLSTELLNVCLRTSVLLCGCGFQMEIPHKGGADDHRTG